MGPGSYVTLPNTKIPLSLLSCSRKDTGLFEVAERSLEGRLHKVGLPFRSPSLACTAIKKRCGNMECQNKKELKNFPPNGSIFTI